MSQDTRAVLRELFEKYGEALLGDEKRLRALLLDLCGEELWQINVVLTAVDADVPGQLAESSRPVELLLPALSEKLRKEHAVEQKAASYAVETWAYALGVAVVRSPSHSKATPSKQKGTRRRAKARQQAGQRAPRRPAVSRSTKSRPTESKPSQPTSLPACPSCSSPVRSIRVLNDWGTIKTWFRCTNCQALAESTDGSPLIQVTSMPDPFAVRSPPAQQHQRRRERPQPARTGAGKLMLAIGGLMVLTVGWQRYDWRYWDWDANFAWYDAAAITGLLVGLLGATGKMRLAAIAGAALAATILVLNLGLPMDRPSTVSDIYREWHYREFALSVGLLVVAVGRRPIHLRETIAGAIAGVVLAMGAVALWYPQALDEYEPVVDEIAGFLVSSSSPACSAPLVPVPEADINQYPQTPEMTVDPAREYTATVKTVRGDFTMRLRPDLAPQHVNSFVFLAREGYFNGVTFHRVLPGFFAQTGDPTGTGSGGPGYTIPAEFTNKMKFERGTVGMALHGDPDGAGSQWFINYASTTNLDGQFTIFGEVTAGMEVVDCITPRDPSTGVNLPPGDQIISIEIAEE